MRTISQIRSRVMKMSHVRRSVDAKLFGKVKEWAEYVRGAWASVKAEIAKAIEEARIAEARAKYNAQHNSNEHSEDFIQGCIAYYAQGGRTYYGD